MKTKYLSPRFPIARLLAASALAIVSGAAPCWSQCKDTLGYLSSQIPVVDNDVLTQLRDTILNTNIQDAVDEAKRNGRSLRQQADLLVQNAAKLADAKSNAADTIRSLAAEDPDGLVKRLNERNYGKIFPLGDDALSQAILQYVSSDWGELAMRESAVQLVCLARKSTK